MPDNVVYITESRRAKAVYQPLPENERTCRNCGTEEKIRRRWRNDHGWWVRLGCTHVQNDDEY